MITQKEIKIYSQSVDKVNTLCYNDGEIKVNTPLRRDFDANIDTCSTSTKGLLKRKS